MVCVSSFFRNGKTITRVKDSLRGVLRRWNGNPSPSADVEDWREKPGQSADWNAQKLIQIEFENFFDFELSNRAVKN